MKIKLREAQVKKAKLITEGQERVDTFMSKADDIKEKVNRIYSRLTFSTLAEILEGNIDLNVILDQLEVWRSIMYTHHDRVDDFFDRIPKDEYWHKWEGLQKKADETFKEITYDKIDILEDLVDKMKDFADSDLEKFFSDIKRVDI